MNHLLLTNKVDCVWGEWTPWSSCPDCYGDLSGFYKEDLETYEQIRTRRVKIRPRYRGKKCGKRNVEMGHQTGECAKSVPACPVAAGGASYLGQWQPWSKCMSECGKRGKRKRMRQCIGTSCEGDTVEEEDCPGFCPPSEPILSFA